MCARFGSCRLCGCLARRFDDIPPISNLLFSLIIRQWSVLFIFSSKQCTLNFPAYSVLSYTEDLSQIYTVVIGGYLTCCAQNLHPFIPATARFSSLRVLSRVATFGFRLLNELYSAFTLSLGNYHTLKLAVLQSS